MKNSRFLAWLVILFGLAGMWQSRQERMPDATGYREQAVSVSANQVS